MQSQATPVPKPSFAPVRSTLLQGSCACGGTPGLDGECAECRRKQLLGSQRNLLGNLLDQATQLEVPPLVPEVPRSSGEPLDAETRSSMEPRFGHDFSRIAVYSDAPVTVQPKLTTSALGDGSEQEAARVAKKVMRRPDHEAASPTKGAPEQPQIGRVQASDAQGAPVPPIAHEVLRSPGQPLDAPSRTFMESGFGWSFSQVQVHTDGKAAEAARALNARAFTAGRHIVFGAGEHRPSTREGQQLLAHELVHVVQQEGAGKLLQRYESGEHARLGETQTELKTAFAPGSYTVRKGDTLEAIAGMFGITIDELKDANKDKLNQWPARDGSGRMIEGFDAGETLVIPQVLNDLGKAAVKDKAAKFTVNGVVLDYGVGIAMGDFFESPQQMAQASPKKLTELANLIKREQSGGKPVTTEEWQNATDGRYLTLAEKNVAHFAPPNPAFVKPSAAGAVAANHKSEWEKNHKAALDASRGGDKDMALMTNAFADHFLTDAFAAGHLFNRPDVMEMLKSRVKPDATGEFTEASTKFFDDVAADAFTGGVKTEFSKYETHEPYKSKWNLVGWNPNINSVSNFSKLLQGIHKEEPDLLALAAAKGLHAKLNTLPGGLPVENLYGDAWNLPGDGTLDAKTTEIARKAVAQSQINVITAFMRQGPLDYPTLYKKVWDYTPVPSGAGAKQLVAEIDKGTDVASGDLKKAVVDLIKGDYMLMIKELVRRKKLKKA